MQLVKIAFLLNKFFSCFKYEQLPQQSLQCVLNAWKIPIGINSNCHCT